MTDSTASRQEAGSASPSPDVSGSAEKTPQTESWPTWCSTCQALRAGEHACEGPESAAAEEIAKPEPVYQRRLPHETGTLRIDRERKDA
ncbi:hypothetical protein PG985_005530 [Apiospora marii]|uniref:uncharacterized protein n=1 Tax=Apiospora marii TaxID=335849 RepID=UPI00312D6B88